MNKLLFSIIFLLVSASSFGQKDLLVDKIAAIVGDRIILESDIEIQYQQSIAQGETGENLRCDILEQQLVQKVLYNQSVIDSVFVTDEEVEGELNSRFQYYLAVLGSEEKFEEYFKKSVVEFKDDFREDVKEQLQARRMQGQVMNDVIITPSEVKEYFQSIPVDSLPYFSAEVEVGELSVRPSISKAKKEEMYKKLRDVRQQILDGEDFNRMAGIHSDEPGASQSGGNLGLKKRGELVPEFEAAAYKLKAGEISDVVETDFGFHIIQLLERRGEMINAQHILMRPDFDEADYQATAGLLDSLRTEMMNDTLSFGTAVKEYSTDEQAVLNNGMLINAGNASTIFELDQLEPNVYFAIDTLQAGEFTKPFKEKDRLGREQYKILYLKSKSKPHLANLEDDYSKLQTIAEAQKKQVAMIDWLKKRIPRTYVKIDEQYHSCGNISDLWLNSSANQ